MKSYYTKIAFYYNPNIEFKDFNFEISETPPEEILNILNGLKPSTEAGINTLSVEVLQDGVDILARSISQLCNLSIKFNSFSRSCKIPKVKALFEKVPKVTLKTNALFHYSSYQKLPKGLFMTKHRNF